MQMSIWKTAPLFEIEISRIKLQKCRHRYLNERLLIQIQKPVFIQIQTPVFQTEISVLHRYICIYTEISAVKSMYVCPFEMEKSAFLIQISTLNGYKPKWNAIKLGEPGHEKMCLISYANNKGADQPAHSRSLISAVVVRCLDSIISLDSIAETSIL